MSGSKSTTMSKSTIYQNNFATNVPVSIITIIVIIIIILIIVLLLLTLLLLV